MGVSDGSRLLGTWTPRSQLESEMVGRTEKDGSIADSNRGCRRRFPFGFCRDSVVTRAWDTRALNRGAIGGIGLGLCSSLAQTARLEKIVVCYRTCE